MGNKRYKPTRYYMYNRIQDFFNSRNFKAGKCLLVGDSIKGVGDPRDLVKNRAVLDMLPDGCKILAPAYPDVDIHHTTYDNEIFDYVIADQVLEHVKRPWVAADEIYRITKPGGYVVITTCLMNHVHGVPEDYFRFTLDGLRVLFAGNFTEIRCEGYGNLDFIRKALTGKYRKPVVPGSKLAKEVTTNNDGKNLYLVWFIGQKK